MRLFSKNEFEKGQVRAREDCSISQDMTTTSPEKKVTTLLPIKLHILILSSFHFLPYALPRVFISPKSVGVPEWKAKVANLRH